MNSASAMAIVKCTQLKGLADKSDYTCKSTHTLISSVANASRWNGRPSHVDQVCSILPHSIEMLMKQHRVQRRHHRLVHPHAPADSRAPTGPTLPQLLQQQ